MKRNLFIILAMTLVTFVAAGELFARGNKEGPIIYVESQELFYDAIIKVNSNTTNYSHR